MEQTRTELADRPRLGSAPKEGEGRDGDCRFVKQGSAIQRYERIDGKWYVLGEASGAAGSPPPAGTGPVGGGGAADPDPGPVPDNPDNRSGCDGRLTNEVVSGVDVGGIAKGIVVPNGCTLTEFVTMLLTGIEYPELTPPTFSFTHGQASNIEAGTIFNLTLTFAFDQGSIAGSGSSGLWDPDALTGRAGPAVLYEIEGAENGTSPLLLIEDYQVQDGSNSFTGQVEFAAGPQPFDSRGELFDAPYPGGIEMRSDSFTGRRRAFWGVDNDALVGSDIRSLGSTMLNPYNGCTFEIIIPPGSYNVVFAYPATLREVSSVKYIEGMSAEVRGIFDEVSIEVPGENVYSPIAYRVYVYEPVEPFGESATYQVTI